MRSRLRAAAAPQVAKREDSETYAKRTITEIETCLGFRFGGDREEEVIGDAEIQVGADTAAASSGACLNELQVLQRWLQSAHELCR